MMLRAHGARPGASTPRAASAAPTLDQAREQVRAASAALARAFRALTRETRSVDQTSVFTTARAVTMLSGLRLDPTSVASRVSSSVSALDVASGGARSRLYSAALGLDVTSAQAASTLKSSATLGLDVTSRASTIASTAEMNTATTSYGSTNLTFSDGVLTSTSAGTLSGVYTGVNTAASATSLVVKATTTAVLSTLVATNVQFEVRDQTNTLLFSYNGSLKAGDTVYLGADIGLSISFSEGQLTVLHTSSTTVSHTATDVDATAVFNDADPNLRPRFEGGAQVTAGSFTVNGTSIAVNANDTINAVLARITASAAGVTATLANDKITLASNSSSEADIVLASDTSGFLSAVKLASATTTRGNIRDDEQVLSATTRFGTVVSGAFTVNGVSISVNKDTDTLAALITRINGSGAGVTASYDSAQDKLILTTTANSEELITVAGDTTGFLTAANLSTAITVRGNIRDDEQVLSKTSQFDAVASGSFTVNGVAISVDKDADTLAELVERINDADAGVTAFYDSTLDKLVLTATSQGGGLITVAGDTTAFLATAGLSTGDTVQGTLPQERVVTQAGTATIDVNGKTITVDVARDTLTRLVDKINGADAGVSAGFNATTNTLTVSNASAVARAVAAAAEKLNEALAQLGTVYGAGTRSELESVVWSAIGALGDAGAKGLRLGVDNGALRLSVDRDKLASALGGPRGEATDLGTVLGDVLERYTGQIAAPGAASVSAPRPQGRSLFQLGGDIKAQLVVDQMSETFGSARAKALLASYLESSKERRQSDPPERPRDRAYW